MDKGLLSSTAETIRKNLKAGKDKFDMTLVLDSLLAIPKELLSTKEGVGLISIITGVLMDQMGLGDSLFRIRDRFRDPKEKWLWDETKIDAPGEPLDGKPSGLVPRFEGNENLACLSMTEGTRITACELKPKLGVEIDIWPWSGLAIPPEFGRLNMPLPKLLITLGAFTMSAEFFKGVGGVIPG